MQVTFRQIVEYFCEIFGASRACPCGSALPNFPLTSGTLGWQGLTCGLLRICVGVAIIFCFAITGPALAREFKSLEDVDLPGYDISSPSRNKRLRNVSLEGCKDACRNKDNCAAFTYNRAVKWCFLKGKASDPTPFTGAVSGILIRRKNLVQETNPSADNSAHQSRDSRPQLPEAYVKRAQTSSSKGEMRSPAKVALPASEMQPSASSATGPRKKVAMNDGGQARQIVEPSFQPSMANTGKLESTSSSRSDDDARVTVVQKTSFRNPPSIFSGHRSALPKEKERQAMLTAPVAMTADTSSQAPETKPLTTQSIATPAAGEIPLPVHKPEQKVAIVKPTKPLTSSNKYAKFIYKKIGQSTYYARKANELSKKYLAKYDKERAGTKWVTSSSFGMSIPMQATKDQAKALVLSKMGKDQKLEKYQDRLARIARDIEKPFDEILPHFTPEVREKLQKLHQESKEASLGFRTARDTLKAWGEKLSRWGNKTWKLPYGKPLDKLHRLAAEMRAKRKEALNAGKAFSDALKSALESPTAITSL